MTSLTSYGEERKGIYITRSTQLIRFLDIFLSKGSSARQPSDNSIVFKWLWLTTGYWRLVILPGLVIVISRTDGVEQGFPK
jgi:hypothetical protein